MYIYIVHHYVFFFALLLFLSLLSLSIMLNKCVCFFLLNRYTHNSCLYSTSSRFVTHFASEKNRCCASARLSHRSTTCQRTPEAVWSTAPATTWWWSPPMPLLRDICWEVNGSALDALVRWEVWGRGNDDF